MVSLNTTDPFALVNTPLIIGGTVQGTRVKVKVLLRWPTWQVTRLQFVEEMQSVGSPVTLLIAKLMYWEMLFSVAQVSGTAAKVINTYYSSITSLASF